MFSETATAASWRERALDRSLEQARARAGERIEALVDAARDLADDTGSASFTVAQVSAKAGQSLKSFYRCFAGKDDLLVALIEEDSRLGAAILAAAVDEHDDPQARLRAYVMGLFELIAAAGEYGYAGVLVREERRLSEARPEQMRAALAPMIGVLEREIERATAAGECSSTDAARDAETIFALMIEGLSDVTLGRVEALDEADYLWGFCWGALQRTTGERGDRTP
jgi:AcrR family transcriptional regulator